ncbi:hypothetical protein CAEBREN_05624 [Caenorhabditis brenneri]|uniref:Uncharacterized protein n=1 Tax=Caenorhabditis brenneri TaxID=135651 RepID=G0MIM9_CAEBE|nr:hypothetical protein CAEBREN_05624 [Caenorhabditis brenneri]
MEREQKMELKDIKNYSEICLKVPPGKYVENRDYDWEANYGLDWENEYLYIGPKKVLDICKLNPLYLVVEPQKFVINPEKGTKFSVKSLSKNAQDVIVTCHSFMFEIKDARRKLGITSQWFHVIGKDETKTFHIVMKDAKNESLENFANSPLYLASGLIEITHYKSRIAGSYTKPKLVDSDEEWGIKGSKLLIRTGSIDTHYHGYWKDFLKVEHETEDVKKREARFKELLCQEMEAEAVRNWTADPNAKMLTDTEYRMDWSLKCLANPSLLQQMSDITITEPPRPPKPPIRSEPPPVEQPKKVEEPKKKKWKLKNIFKKKKKN